ncbi:hypothetical protein, partial [Asanoa sp. NPDC050611]|uniref:alpha/beta hydrolase family protein n=1 Tax=Asanoa sp. NPDC050611 TaxID=3157098 RepID=UPI0033C679EA
MTRRRVVGGALAAAATSAFGTAGAGYYFSGELLGVEHLQELVVRALAVDGDEVTLSRDDDTAKPIALGLLWPDGGARLTAEVRVDGDTVVRRVDEVVAGELRPGFKVAVDYNVFGTDPKTAFGLDYATVPVAGELGDLPAWLVPPPGGHRPGMWAIAVHGRGGSRHEALRVLPDVVKAGLTMLVIGYRNDPDAPASPDGYYHLGDTEWRDLAAAIRYAREHGATGIVLFGWSYRRTPSSDTWRPRVRLRLTRTVSASSPTTRL